MKPIEVTSEDLDPLRSAMERRDERALEAALTNCKALMGRLSQPIYWSSGRESPGASAKWFAQHLVNKVHSRGASKTLHDFVEIYATGTVRGEHIATIYGVRTEAPLQIGEGFSVVPLAPGEPPGEPEREEQWARYFPHTTALTMSVTDRQCRNRNPKTPEEDQTEVLRKMEEVLGVLSVACRRGIFRGIHWGRSENCLWHLGLGLILNEVPVASPMSNPVVTPEQAAECRRLHPLLLRLSDKPRNVLSFSLRGYRRAVDQPMLEQLAVPLTVAFEGLLMQGEQGDLVQNVSLRGAWLLGRDAAERTQYAALLRSLYKVRNAFVHTGGRQLGWGLCAGDKELQEIREAEKLYPQMVVRLLEHGVPTGDQWTEIILGRDFGEVMGAAGQNAESAPAGEG